jgi:outer membrane protein TolC
LPADVLALRPDVASAWQRLAAADWNVRAARAARLPAVRITASGQYTSDAFADLFDNWLVNLAGNLSAPVFDAGRRRAEVRRNEAIADERFQQYRQTVLDGLAEVRNSLVQEQGQDSYIQALEKELKSASAAYRQAFRRYGRGQENYLRVLTARSDEETLQRSLVDARYQRLGYRIQLYRSAGGDWERVLDEIHSPGATVGEETGVKTDD